MVTRTFKVTVFRRTFGEKGALTSEVVDEALSGMISASSEEAARFVAQVRAVQATDGVDLGDATAVGNLARELHIDVEVVRPSLG